MSNALVVARLVKFGWLAANAILSEPEIVAALKRYAEFFGLIKGTRGVAGAKTEDLQQHILTPRCGCADVRRAGAALCRWPITTLRVTPAISGLNVDDALVGWAIEAAIADWEHATGLAFARWDAPTGAHIVMRAGRIDGAGSVLAWSELPSNATASTSLNQLYDSQERWYAELLRAVIAHELGHALGLEHSSNPQDLMYPIVNSSNVSPQAGDVAEARKRYPRGVTPDPVPPTKQIATLEVHRPLDPGVYEVVRKA